MRIAMVFITIRKTALSDMSDILGFQDGFVKRFGHGQHGFHGIKKEFIRVIREIRVRKGIIFLA